MYRLIACDLDETLLSSDGSISKRNIEAIKKASSMGVKFVLATGRGFISVQDTLKTLGLYNKENEYVISYNGGGITENKDNRLLHFEGISFDLAQELYRRGLEYGLCVHVHTLDMVYVYDFTQEERDYLSNRIAATETFERNLDFLSGQDIIKVIYMNFDYNYLHHIEEELKNIIQDVDVSYSSNRYMEFNHKGVNKGAGLKILAGLLNIPIEETIAVGDNYNDLSMIKAANLGIGVHNTVEKMKQECDYITKGTNDEDAIAEIIEKFILNRD